MDEGLPMRTALAAACVALALSARAAAPDPVKPLRPIVGAWSGSFNCKTGNYDAHVGIEDAEGGLFARYDAASTGPIPLSAKGDVGVVPRAKPGEFTATSNGVAVKITLAEKGQVLVFAPAARADGAAAAIRFAGTARLDKKRTKAVVRFTVTTPLGPDSCMGSMARD